MPNIPCKECEKIIEFEPIKTESKKIIASRKLQLCFNCVSKQVYCTECLFGKELIDSITENKTVPVHCRNCESRDPEDSMPLYVRSNYVQK